MINADISLVDKMPEQTVKGAPVVLSNPMVPSVKAKEIVTWQQRDEDVRSIACHSYGGAGVTILSSSHLRVYKQNEGNMFHSNEHDDQGDRVATFRNRCHAVLDRRLEEVRLHCIWPVLREKEYHTISVRGQAGCAISGTENYLVFSTQKNSKSSKIHCYSVKQCPPKSVWQRNFGSHTPRSLSAMETANQLVVVDANSCSDGTPEINASAIVAVNSPAKYLWKISFESLDKEAEMFDLRDMCNDGKYFYVLNREESCVYLISVEGQVLSKILQNLDRPRAIAGNTKRKDLVVASSGGAVKVYKLKYKEKNVMQ